MIYASDLDRTLIYSLNAIGVPENTPSMVLRRLWMVRRFHTFRKKHWLI